MIAFARLLRGNFYDAIQGFAHERGNQFELRVARRALERPPADGSSVAYRLLRIVRRDAAPVSGS